MKHIVIDLEMNKIARSSEARKICKSEIIEIGAVMLDENLQEIGNFRTYVKPEYNDKIAAEIRDHRGDGSECTGIQGSIPDVHKLVPGNRRRGHDLCLE